jgi:hexosaminidase
MCSVSSIQMNQRSVHVLLFVALGILALMPASGLAQSSHARRNLKILPDLSLPELKEAHLHDGGFRVGPETRIVVEFGHQSEDRIAAEILAEKISDDSGLKLDIIGAKPGRRRHGGAIVLARLQDPKVRRFLASKGLNADNSIGEQGYLLFSDQSHLIVAANTGQGLFSGVQTLRELLRPDGKNLICPAVAIRDWPGVPVPSSRPGVL